MAKSKKTIIQKIATKHNISLQKVEEVVNYQFKYVSKIMKEGNFESIRLPYFGKFHVKEGRIKNIEKYKNGSTDNK